MPFRAGDLNIDLLPPVAAAARQRRLLARRLNKFYWFALMGLLLTLASYGAVYATLNEMERITAAQLRFIADLPAEQAGPAPVTNELLQFIRQRLSQPVPWLMLAGQVLATANDGITISSLALQPASFQGMDTKALIVKGAAASAADLTDFERNLTKLSWVDHIDSPLQNLALQENRLSAFTTVIYSAP